MGGMKRTLATLGKGGGHRSPSVWKPSTGQVQINMFKLQHTHMSICSPTLHSSTLQRRKRDFECRQLGPSGRKRPADNGRHPRSAQGGVAS